ncbi:MAG: translocation/assembly module TamB domain-containing protein [Burkholderiaceae bacterium]|jgi:translocation and assembly module TamB|nr:translocation/assembly module TamB domain-containing protein [Burkholderiaceae bacterium]
MNANAQDSASSPPRRRRWLRVLAWSLAGLVAVLLLALSGLWVWAGTEGSLATALRWAGAMAPPLSADGVSGSLRGGGTVRRLTWQQNGLRVRLDNSELRWTSAALFSGILQIDRLSAGRIEIDDKSPKSNEPSAGPPQSLALPLKVQVNTFAIGEVHWAGPPPQVVRDIAGRFDYDGTRHLLTLERTRAVGGQFQARAAITAHAPVSIDLTLTGTLVAPAPENAKPLPLAVQAALQGALTDLRAQADLRVVQADTSASNVTDTPTAHAEARITPWAAQPLPEAHAEAHALDLGALAGAWWADAPQTLLSGRFDLTPLAPDSPAGWAIKADLSNAAAGPWDQRRLPLQGVQADLSWADNVATVRALSLRVGGGTVEAGGRWAAAADKTSDDWRINARIDNLDPGQLHTQLAAPPLDGTAQVSGAGAVIDFDAALQARAGRNGTARTLHLRDLQAKGRWQQAVLSLDQLRLRTDDAALDGQARIDTAAPGGNADLSFTAPGLTLALKGEVQPERGDGTLRTDIRDAARLLAWARKLPGAGQALQNMQARGRATLQADWRGGWRNPTLDARLNAPQLAWQASASAQPIQARDLGIRLSGELAKARLEVGGHLAQGERRLDLRLAAGGGRTTAADVPLAQANWRVALESLQVDLREPALGQGAWQLALRGAVPLTWSPQNGGRLEVSAGELRLTAPTSEPPARIAWGPAHWSVGAWATSGRITGLSLAWVERLSGDASPGQTGFSGDLVLEGGWDADLGRELRLSAHLARASGDLSLLADDPSAGVRTRVAAGLRQARVSLTSDGQAINLQLKWDSAQAGTVEGALRTELRAISGGNGTENMQWDWPSDAALQGRLQARLPRLSVWSVMAPPGWRLRGALTADTRIGGTRAAPLLTGTLAADRLALRSMVDGVQLTNGRLRARLDGTRLLIDEFSLHGARKPGSPAGSGGTLRASGEAGWIEGRAQARLTATLDKLRASIQADRQLTVSGQVQAALQDRHLKADGNLRVDQAHIVLPDQSAPSLSSDVIVRGADAQAAKKTPATANASEPQEQDNPLTVAADVKLDLGEDFRLKGMGIDTRLAGTLTLAANGPLTAMPKLTGTVHTVKGTVSAYGQQLNIERGNIVFTGDASNPTLDIIALRPNYSSDQRVGAQVMGSALLPRVRLYSQPVLPDNETLAWLLLGRPAPSTGAEAAMLQSAALALMGGRDGRPLASRFGLDELSFSGASEGSIANASVTLGKRLSDRLYAAYEHSLSGTGGALMVFYQLSRRWTLRGQAGENAAADLIYRLAFD